MGLFGLNLDWRSLKRRMLVAEASRWIGTQEVGENGGQIIEMFQVEVDGKAVGESYCLAFAQYCCRMVDEQFYYTYPEIESAERVMVPVEACVAFWKSAKPKAKLTKPLVGSLVLWQTTSDPVKGHCGIVVEPLTDGYFGTVEANISGKTGNEPAHDGVWKKQRSAAGTQYLRLLGYYDPWM